MELLPHRDNGGDIGSMSMFGPGVQAKGKSGDIAVFVG